MGSRGAVDEGTDIAQRFLAADADDGDVVFKPGSVGRRGGDALAAGGERGPAQNSAHDVEVAAFEGGERRAADPTGDGEGGGIASDQEGSGYSIASSAAGEVGVGVPGRVLGTVSGVGWARAADAETAAAAASHAKRNGDSSWEKGIALGCYR